MEHVAQARWLVPVVAVAAEVDESGPHAVDTRSDMAAVTLTSPDGSRALPMFTSLESLAAWDPSARPGAGPRGGRGAGRDQRGVPGARRRRRLGPRHGAAAEHAVGARAGARLGAEPPRRPRGGRRASGRREPSRRSSAHRVEAGEPAGAGVLRVVLALEPGLDADVVGAIATRIGERIATDGETRARIDALTFALEAAR